MSKTIEKVLVYVTRETSSGSQVLVFDHFGMPEAGTQVPAGSVEPGEILEKAALREVTEETGLLPSSAGRFIGRAEWYRQDRNEIHFRNIFHFKLNLHSQDEWMHRVCGSGEDKDLLFRCFWLPIETAKTILAVEQGKYLGWLTREAGISDDSQP